MTVPLVLFAIAALGGLVMATQRLRGAPQPTLAIALVHGALAAVALILLIVAVASTAVPTLAKAALVLFIVAALGGFFLFAQHMQKKALPIPVMIVHAGVAVIAFICLLVAAVGTI
jgi:hypothetical protein